MFLVMFENRARDGWARCQNEKNKTEHFDLLYLEFLR